MTGAQSPVRGPFWRRPLLQRALLCAFVAFLLAAIPSFAWWYIQHERAPPRLVALDIPAGSAAAVAAGAQPPAIPDDLRIGPRSTLRIRNDDSAAHQIGPLSIPAGTTIAAPASMLAAATGKSTFVCTFQAGGSIEITTVEEPSAGRALLVSFMVALPLAIAGFAVVSVTERL